MVRSTLPREIVVAKLFRWSSDSSDISKMGHSIQDELLKVDGFEERRSCRVGGQEGNCGIVGANSQVNH